MLRRCVLLLVEQETKTGLSLRWVFFVPLLAGGFTPHKSAGYVSDFSSNVYIADPVEKQRHPLTDAVFHAASSCETFNLCLRFRSLLGLPGQILLLCFCLTIFLCICLSVCLSIHVSVCVCCVSTSLSVLF